MFSLRLRVSARDSSKPELGDSLFNGVARLMTWNPAYSPMMLAALGIGAVALASALVATSRGVVNRSRRWAVLALRVVVLLVLLAILGNPVLLDTVDGPPEDPRIALVLDTSESMKIGSPTSRIDQAKALVEPLLGRGDLPYRLEVYTFDQRLNV